MSITGHMGMLAYVHIAYTQEHTHTIRKLKSRIFIFVKFRNVLITIIRFSFKTVRVDWRAGSTIKSICCSSRGHDFTSQYSHQGHHGHP